MRRVSQAWRQAIQLHRTEHVRNRMAAEVYFGQFDASARPDATLSTNMKKAAISGEFQNINTDNTQQCSYGSFEGNGFLLDGTQRFLPKSDWEQQGFLSSVLSKEDGTFSEDPTITVVFSEPHSMVGLTLLFDDTSDIFPDRFTVVTYLKGEEVASHAVENNSSRYEGELAFTDFDQMVITFTKTRAGFQRIHLQQILFGIGYVYDSESLLDLSFTRENSPLSLSLPKYELSFSVFNDNGRFNVDADTPIVRFLKNDQRAVLSIGLDLTGEGDMEYIQLCDLWLSSWSVNGTKATFKCTDVFQRLNEGEYEDSDYGEVTAIGRLEALMAFAGYGDYEFAGTYVENIPVTNPFPAKPVSQLLQLTANLCMGTLESDENSRIILRNRLMPEIANLSITGEVEPYSQVSDLTSTDPVQNYATYETDFFALDGGELFLPEEPDRKVGLVWTGLPNEERLYDPEPTVTIDLAANSTFGALTLVFPYVSVPSSITVQGFRYVDGEYVLAYEKAVTNLSPETVLYDVYDRLIRMVITIHGNEKANLARLQRVGISWDTGYSITEEDIIGNPKGQILTACKDIIVDRNDLEPEEKDQLTKSTVTTNEWTTLKHSNPVSDVAATTSVGTVEIESHAYFTKVFVTAEEAEAEVTLSGKEWTNKAKNTTVLNLNRSGEDLEIENPLIDSNNLDESYLDWVSGFAGSDTEFQIETLGYPELDAGDRISYKGQNAVILKHALTFNGGACRSKFTIRKV